MSRVKKEKDRSFGEKIALNLRALGIWWEQDRQVFFAMLAAPAFEVLIPYVNIYFSAQIIGELAGKCRAERLWKLVLIVLLGNLILSSISAGISRWKEYKLAYLWQKEDKIYASKMTSLDFAVLDRQDTYDLRSQIMQNRRVNGWGIQRSLKCLEQMMQAVCQILGAFVLTYSLFASRVPGTAGRLAILNHPLAAAGMAAMMLLAAVSGSSASNRARSYWVRDIEKGKLGNRIFCFFGMLGGKKERALDMRLYEQQKLCGWYLKQDDSYNVESKLAGYARGPMGALEALSAMISALLTGVIYLFVCLKAWGGAFGIGEVTQYVASAATLFKGVSGLVDTWGFLYTNAEYLKVTFEFLDLPNEMYQGSLTTEKRSDRQYEVEFRDVSFRYPGSDVYALRHVSMKFRVGERMAVVGMNGSGKTTFIKLLCRLYDPTEGEILLNGINIRKYRYDDYLNIFAIVFQDFKLLPFGLGQNVAASAVYDDARARDCLEKAGFADRILRMPKGLSTCLYKDFEKEGVEISGGEAQKIALARALYKDAPFIILDEPTAALDPVAEAEVYSKFSEIVEDKTAVYISHRLSSCKFCDEIAVFHEGRIVQQGTHEELVADESGKYHELWYAQAQYYTESAKN